MGGAHTRTHPILSGLAAGKPIGLVQIDAHADTARGTFQGNRLNDCSVFLNAVLDEATPVYVEMPGWSEDISGVRQFNDLPEVARNYVLEIERLIECRIRYVSVGPEREALIDRG